MKKKFTSKVTEIIMLTSNVGKLREFQLQFPMMDCEKGRDILEVMGTPEEVILYKSIEAGKGYAVEDTILTVNGVEQVDIKYTRDKVVKQGDKLEWITNVGFNDGNTIFIFSGITKGTADLTRRDKRPEFAFEDFFIPEGSNRTLVELGPNKILHSARTDAVTKMLEGKVDASFEIKEVPVWAGTYQQ